MIELNEIPSTETSSSAIIIRLAQREDLLGIARLFEKQFFEEEAKRAYASCQKVKGRRGRIRSVCIQLQKPRSFFVVAEMGNRIGGAIYVRRTMRNRIFISNMAVSPSIRQVEPTVLFKMTRYYFEHELLRPISRWTIHVNFENRKAVRVFLRIIRSMPEFSRGQFMIKSVESRQSWLERLKFGYCVDCAVIERQK
ncbi:MAG: hypothetical protein MI864_18015 [Pseudomonadales bacterium]|nr:hypothetical protein [Pseudomonadales bacterium]